MHSLPLLIYDGDCGVCKKWAQRAQKMDHHQVFELHPYQDFSAEALAQWDLDSLQCRDEMKVVNPKGKVYGGAIAFNYFLWHFWPWKILVFFIYLIPLFLLLEILGYKIFAKNRHHVSKWMGLKSCEKK